MKERGCGAGAVTDLQLFLKRAGDFQVARSLRGRGRGCLMLVGSPAAGTVEAPGLWCTNSPSNTQQRLAN